MPAACTLRSNRTEKADQVLKTEKELKKEGRGSMDSVVSDGIIVTKWFDNKEVNRYTYMSVYVCTYIYVCVCLCLSVYCYSPS